MMRLRWSVALSAMVLALAVSCSSGSPARDAETGRRIFVGEIALTDNVAQACSSCHAAQAGEAEQSLGNNLSNVGNRAATTVDNVSAEEYLRTSIVDPDAYLAANFQEGIMPRNYKAVLSGSQIKDLVAYMLTLKDESAP